MDVTAMCEAGRSEWPSVTVAPDDFAAFLSERITPDGVPPAVADLYLACGCWRRDESAVSEFTATFLPEIERVAARASAPGVSAEDARQILLERILVGNERTPAKIGSYKGKGTLRGWVRVTAIRLLIDIFRSGGQGRETTVEQALLEEIAGAGDPELDYLKTHYRDQFRAAFEAAVAALDARSTNYLRHMFVDRLTIDQLASLYGTHRSTAARRLAAARDALLEQTREQLASRLRVDSEEADSIIRLICSRIELSVQRIFAE